MKESLLESFDQLFSAILLEQQKINKIKGPDPGKEHLIENKLKDFERARGRGFFYNYMSSGKGHGPLTQLIDGSVKYDLINGIGVNLLGHSHPLFIKSNLEAAMSDTIMCGNLLPYEQAYETCQSLVNAVKGKSRLAHFWYAGSGSFSNDTALKLVWQKRAPRYKVLAFTKAFAGRSVAMQDITYNDSYREGMPQTVEVERVPHFDQKDPENALSKTLKALEEAWNKAPDQYAVMTLELIQGEGGFIFGNRDYYVGIFEWAKSKGIPIWVDEVQTFGRTHQLFAFQMFELDQYVDLVTVAKAFQACGVLFTEEMNPKPGLIAGTFHGSLSAIICAQKTLKLLLEGPFYGKGKRIAQIEESFLGRAKELMNGSCKGKITYAGGIGTMIALEVGHSDKDGTNKFLKKLFDNGVIAFSAGSDPVRVRFLLPITLTDEHLNEIFSIIEKTILEVF